MAISRILREFDVEDFGPGKTNLASSVGSDYVMEEI